MGLPLLAVKSMATMKLRSSPFCTYCRKVGLGMNAKERMESELEVRRR